MKWLSDQEASQTHCTIGNFGRRSQLMKRASVGRVKRAQPTWNMYWRHSPCTSTILALAVLQHSFRAAGIQ